MESPLKRAHVGFVLCIAFATLSSAGDVSPRFVGSAAPEAKPAIEITSAISHPNAGAMVGVIYLRLINTSLRSDRLIAAHTSMANRSELHETVAHGDFVRMTHRPEGFRIPAGGELVLEGGGKHIMLGELREPLVEGNSIDLELVFEHADSVRVRVPIVPRTF